MKSKRMCETASYNDKKEKRGVLSDILCEYQQPQQME